MKPRLLMIKMNQAWVVDGIKLEDLGLTVKIDDKKYEKISEYQIIKHIIDPTDNRTHEITFQLEKSSELTNKLFDMKPEILAEDYINVSSLSSNHLHHLSLNLDNFVIISFSLILLENNDCKHEFRQWLEKLKKDFE